jgi:polyhydroxyalkanoate synthesis regulator phasin
MNQQNGYREEQEVNQYEKLAARTKELLVTAREKTPKAVEEALEKAKEEMVTAGEFSREQGKRVQAFLRRDLEATRDSVAQMGQTLKEALEPQRVASGIQSTLAHILDALGDTLKDFASKTEERLTYRTGELSSPGKLTCNSCGSRIHMTTTGRVPPCAKCHGTEFRKSY